MKSSMSNKSTNNRDVYLSNDEGTILCLWWLRKGNRRNTGSDRYILKNAYA